MDDQQLPAQTNTIDTCRYNLHFPSNVSPTVLANTIPDLLTFVASLSSNYIWHKQPFTLQLSAASFSSTTKQQYLEGKTDCTDCVDDEWFIVWLLREMTRNWKDAVISVSDEDGEFLLIEGAEVLPKWVTPQNAENRVRFSSYEKEVRRELTSFRMSSGLAIPRATSSRTLGT